jgi:hypothetical protein
MLENEKPILVVKIFAIYYLFKFIFFFYEFTLRMRTQILTRRRLRFLPLFLCSFHWNQTQPIYSVIRRSCHIVFTRWGSLLFAEGVQCQWHVCSCQVAYCLNSCRWRSSVCVWRYWLQNQLTTWVDFILHHPPVAQGSSTWTEQSPGKWGFQMYVVFILYFIFPPGVLAFIRKPFFISIRADIPGTNRQMVKPEM